MADEVVLKKYANRRLYDTHQSAYVTLEEVADMVKSGRVIRAVDAKTGEDVTAFVLTQIVLENARKNNALLPVPLLEMIIRYGDNVLAEFFDNYLEAIINNYLDFKRQTDEQFKKWVDLGMGLSDAAKHSMTGVPPFTFFKTPGGGKNEDSEDY